MKATKLLLDTDVLIDFLRGHEQAAKYIESLSAFSISVISVAELYAGVKGKNEELALNQFMQVLEIIPLDAETAQLGGRYRQAYGKSHGTGLADALIAATSTLHCAKLVTQNIKHYPMLDSVVYPYKK